MADWYTSSAAWSALPQFAASGVYTVGQIVRPLTAPATGKAHAFRCTTAGTAATEPTWPTANNGTVTTGGATFTNVTGQSAYGWGAAAGDLYSISQGAGWNRPVAGDRVFLSSDHSESFSSGVNWIYSFNGGSNAFGLIQFISVNRAGSVPPVVADVSSGAAITATLSFANANLIMDSFCSNFWQGLTFTVAGSSAGGFLIGYQGSKSSYFKNCRIVISVTNAACIGSAGGVKCFLDNTTVQFGNASQYIGNTSSSSPFDFTWINTPSAIQGGTVPGNLFTLSGPTTNLFTCRGIDISAVTGTLLAISTAVGSGSRLLLDSCRIAPAVMRMSAPVAASPTGDEVEVVNCHDGTNVINERHTLAGDVTADRSTYLTSGAQDDIGNYAFKLISSPRSDFATMPLDCFAFDVENTVTGVSKTATVEIVSSGSFNNNDIRLLLEYMGTVQYTTWNPSDLAGETLSNGNLTATCTAAGGVRAIGSAGTGTKYYFELRVSPWSTFGNTLVGVGTGTGPPGSPTNSAYMGQGGGINVNGVNVGNLGSRSAGDIIGIALDLVNSMIWFRVAPSGNWNASGTANPATNTGGFSVSALTLPLYPFFSCNNGGDACTANFGSSAFTGTVPSGFTAGWGVPSGTSVANFVDSLPSVLTAAAALPASAASWTVVAPPTWNPVDIVNVTLTGSNLVATFGSGSVSGGARSNLSIPAGKIYFELTWTTSTAQLGCGIANSSANLSSPGGANAVSINQGGLVYVNQWSSSAASVGAFSTGNVCCIAVDTVNNLIWIRNGASGSWNATSGTANNPASGTGGISISVITGPFFAYIYGAGTNGGVITANLGNSTFAGIVPSGFTGSWSPSSAQHLQTTFTPQRVGRVRGLVRLGKPSTTCWVNPQIAIT